MEMSVACFHSSTKHGDLGETPGRTPVRIQAETPAITTQVSRGFLNLSRFIPGQYLDKATTVSFQIIYHHIFRSYTSSVLKHRRWNNLRKDIHSRWVCSRRVYDVTTLYQLQRLFSLKCDNYVRWIKNDEHAVMAYFKTRLEEVRNVMSDDERGKQLGIFPS